MCPGKTMKDLGLISFVSELSIISRVRSDEIFLIAFKELMAQHDLQSKNRLSEIKVVTIYNQMRSVVANLKN